MATVSACCAGRVLDGLCVGLHRQKEGEIMWYVIGGIVIGTLVGAVIVWLFCLRKCAKCSEAHYEKTPAQLWAEAEAEVQAVHEAKVEKAKQSMNKAKSAAFCAAEEMGERR